MKESKRNFLKNVGLAAGGIAIASTTANLGLIKSVVAEETKAEEAQEDFNWEVKELPCDLIKEVTDSSTREGWRAFEYTPEYRAHITNITFEVSEDDYTVDNIEFTDGCDGSTMGVAVMANGKDADFIVSRLKGLECNLIKSGSSCPDQLALAVEQARNIMMGLACTNCLFTNHVSASACINHDGIHRA